MKRYFVTSSIVITVHTEVEANSVREAKRIALGRGVMSLCHHCASIEGSDEWVTSGELDGQPEKILDIHEVE